jgi:hypothetical protein
MHFTKHEGASLIISWTADIRRNQEARNQSVGCAPRSAWPWVKLDGEKKKGTGRERTFAENG